MGCVLGKRGTRRKRESNQRRATESAAAVINEAEGGRRNVPEFRLRIGAGAEAWPPWLVAVAGDEIKGWEPRRANSFKKLAKIGQGTYSNVYKARDLMTGKVVALKKVRFDNFEPEAVRFMAREILVLRRLNHPNVIKLEGLVISRMSSSLYLVFEYMEHDLSGLAAVQSSNFTEAQVKCYMKQLISGLEHCHSNGVLHRDIKCSNLLIDNEGILKIADFGLATFFNPESKKPMTSRVVTLWYRPPELLLGATSYGVGVDLWSAGCILAELLSGKPILRGRTEVEQLHKIFKLCGSPPEEFWKKSKLPNVTLYKPQQPYKCCIKETFKDFPPSSLALIGTLLSIDPHARGTATAALNSKFFTTEPCACEPSSLPKFPPTKEMDLKLRDEAANSRQRGLGRKSHIADGHRRSRVHNKAIRAIPAPEANAELQTNLNRLRVMSDGKGKSKSEKFPPPHQDGAVGHPMSFADDVSVTSSTFDTKSLTKSASSRRKNGEVEPHGAPSHRFMNAFYPSSVARSMEFRFGRR
ncbi:probable serine/threonine-protein kinase At1g54610 isoform X1 [Salvia splendens]|uniref:probable serine/threonine-protein kinase At1g54610 isoform X1 n=1 Tax=Salvia splendens TaxID=180675 RepID=UPI001C271D59|nr:probable serine/threonine-protein kinase At1g54610 isoform X1 [Salvia splendens]